MTKTKNSPVPPKNSSEESNLLRNLAELINETNLSEIEYEKEGLRIKVARNFSAPLAPMPTYVAAPAAQPVSSSAPAQVNAPAAAPSIDVPGEVIKSPMVGMIYLAPEPGAKPFVSVGDQVSEGQTICLIEAMKTFNSVAAPKSGVVRKIIAKNGSPIEFDEPIMVIE